MASNSDDIDLEIEINKSINEVDWSWRNHILDDDSDLPLMIDITSDGPKKECEVKRMVYSKN